MPINDNIRHLHIEIDAEFRRLLKKAVIMSDTKNIRTFVKSALTDKILTTLKNGQIIDETVEAIDRLEQIKAKENL